ncbi:hypothetical protein LTR65_004261 [Meristemomyces frigidus]
MATPWSTWLNMNALNILPSYTDYFSLTTGTLALNTSSIWLGSAISGLFYGKVTDRWGRRPALFWSAVLTAIAVVIQAAAQNIGMFLAARILIGVGTGASTLAGSVYLAETLPYGWRVWGLGILYDFYYVGGLLSAGITYGTASMGSTWAWRIPSALQGLFSIICILLLPFLPESPRWLAYQGRNEEALEVVALTHANGDREDPIVLAQYREIVETLEWEKSAGETLSLLQTVKTPSSRKRMILSTSVAVIACLSGNNIVSFYLGSMLDNAGITDSTTQLEINIILNVWCLVIALVGTWAITILGRKKMAVISAGLLTVFLFMVGAMTKVYGTSSNTSGIYGTVAAIFLFQGSYSFGWTPLSTLYPPEVLNYSIRSNGMGVYTVVTNAVGLMVTMAFPYALDAIGWKTYMINGAWDVLQFVFVLYYWVETAGKTLEEIDEVIDGTKHSDVPNITMVIEGVAVVNDAAENGSIHRRIKDSTTVATKEV